MVCDAVSENPSTYQFDLRNDEGYGKLAAFVGSEDSWWAKRILCLGERFPKAEEDQKDHANDQRCDHQGIRGRHVCGIDDADQCQTDTWNDKESTDIVETSYGLFPWHALGMLRWEIEKSQSDERDYLCDKAAVEDVDPGVSIVDGVAADNWTDDDDEEDEAIRETDTDVTVSIGHELWDGAHGLQTEWQKG